ncbi:Polysaccharide biosynthesis protein [Microbulbifer aggregans]|uniref:Polysaccharide biosynthesis protein n=1 Tax=Microbulbifer aggregans TaxID=1769779 RepID=A0A1C9W7R4_9GAMM|nr:oligosaccharide flippase family protein [Microbulbifer aggregans]AOS97197.1 Polysaccharide biosynthesis protein [Microbulbifer aggregans]
MFKLEPHLTEVLKGSATTFVLKMFGMGLGYVVISLIAMRGGAEGVGAYSLIQSLLQFLSLLAMMGMNNAILKYSASSVSNEGLSKLRGYYSFSLSRAVTLSLLVAVILCLLSGPLSHWLDGGEKYQFYLYLVAVALPLSVLLLISVEVLRGLSEIKLSEWFRSININLLNVCVFLGAGLVLYPDPVLSYILAVLASSLLCLYVLYTRLKGVTAGLLCKEERRDYLAVSYPMYVTALCTYLLPHSAIFIIQYFLKGSDVGVYSLCLKLSLLVGMVLLVFNTMLAPKLARMHVCGQPMNDLIGKSSLTMTLLSAFIGLFFIVFAEQVLALWGEDFIRGSLLLRVLVLAQVINSTFGIAGTLLNMTGHQSVVRWASILTLIVNVALLWVFVPIYGIEAAGIGVLTNALLMNSVLASYVYFRLDIKIWPSVRLLNV